ncbi:MAG: response regulator [Chloroflexi bacterium]|nr:response regulator [Chloroflexota bacterium]
MERKRKVILCIEDDQDFIDLMQLMLNDDNTEVVPAVGGEAGLLSMEKVEPDLVLLDLMMPDMHGWEVFMKLKADERFKKIPVIVVTALATRYDRTFGLRVAGVNDYITKPFMPSRLRQSVSQALAH